MGPSEPVADASVRRLLRADHRLGDQLFSLLALLSAVAFLALFALILVTLFQDSWASIVHFGPAFLWTNIWNPVPPQQFGALPFIYGTLVTAALAMLFGVPLSLGVAIFLTELSPSWLRDPISFLVELLAAVPSVVYGLWGFFVLSHVMATTIEPPLQAIFGHVPVVGLLFTGTPIGVDKLTAGVILAIMVIPTISAISREALAVVPQSQREAALSLGATRWETTRLSVLSYARIGIFGAITLGLGRAIGETIAVTFTIGNRNVLTTSLLDQGQTIASWIANNFTEAGPLELSALIELGLVLLLISLAVNIGARVLIRRLGRLREGAP